MTDELTQSNKRLVWQFWQEIDAATPAALPGIAAGYLAGDVAWTGFHPFNELAGCDAVVAGWWQPLRAAFPDVRRETYILLGGSFEGKEWVSATGCFVGTFAADWVGIPASGKATSIRFGEFCASQGWAHRRGLPAAGPGGCGAPGRLSPAAAQPR